MTTTFSGEDTSDGESGSGESSEAVASSSLIFGDEEGVIADVLSGDTERFAVLVERYQAEVAKQMWRFSRDLTTRDDLVQEVFVEAFTGLERFRGQSPFLHWLRVIAVRVGYRFWKNREKQKKQVPLEEWDGAYSHPDEGGGHEVQQQRAAAAGKLLFSLLERLKAEERVVLTLMYYEKSPVAEIAKRLGWSEAMVKMRAYRARRKLKKIIETENILEKLPWTV